MTRIRFDGSVPSTSQPRDGAPQRAFVMNVKPVRHAYKAFLQKGRIAVPQALQRKWFLMAQAERKPFRRFEPAWNMVHTVQRSRDKSTLVMKAKSADITFNSTVSGPPS